MKRNFVLLAALTIGLSITSCFRDNFNLAEKEITFASNIQKLVPASRVVDNLWDESDSIGIYMVSEESMDIVDAAENIQYVASASGAEGSFLAKDNPIYFPDNGDKVRFLAYHPYNSKVIDRVYKVDVSDQSNQSAIDLLYSFNPDALYSKETKNERVSLSFDHMLTKIIINVKPGDGLSATDLENIETVLTGVNREVEFDLNAVDFQNYANKGTISPRKTEVKNGYSISYEAIVVPTIDVLGAQIVFDLKNGIEGENIASDVFRWDFDATLIRSTRYIYNVTINRSGITVESSINDWLSGGESDISAE